MKIYTENFRRFSKVIEASYLKGDRIGQNIYLDFENSFAFFSDDNFIGKLKFDFTSDPQEVIPNLLVDKSMFLTLCQQYDELNLTEDYEFYNGVEKFKIPYFLDRQDYPDFDYQNFESYQLTSSIIQDMKVGSAYIGPYDPHENYYGLAFTRNTILTTDSAQVFEARIEESDEQGNTVDYPELKIKGDIVRLILIVAEEEVCYVHYNEDNEDLYFTAGDNNELHIATTLESNLKIPDVEDSDYISKYHHDTYFTVEKQGLLDILEFFEPFVKNERNERIYLYVKDNDTLSIETQAENKGNRHIHLKDCSQELIGDGIWVPRAFVYKAVSSINDDFITFEVDSEKPAFNVVGETNINRHVVIVRLV